MPEGDTIHRTAAALRTALVDQQDGALRGAPAGRASRPGPGARSSAVESHGKHLEIEWDDGVILHTHMRMSGSWHLYRPGETWQRPHHQMRALIEVDGVAAVCFNAPVVETYRSPGRLPPSRARRRSGPTSAGSTPTSTAASSCCCPTTIPTRSLGEVLLDQRVFCGVGNVYRCEVLWAGELSPFAQVGDLPEADGDAPRQRRRQAAAGQPAPRRARRPARRPGRARRLRAQRAALPALQRDDRGPARRRATPRPVLVPRLPGPARPAAARPRHRRPTSTPPPSCSPKTHWQTA